jgi:hypothetical protein
MPVERACPLAACAEIVSQVLTHYGLDEAFVKPI